MPRKGISPILASVLLLAVTISVAGIFSGWAPNIANTVTGEAENQTTHRLDCNKASAQLISATYNSSGNNDVDITLRNDGREDLEQLILAAFDENDSLMKQEANVSLNKGELGNDSISSVSSEPSYIKLFSEKCGDVTSTLDEINQ